MDISEILARLAHYFQTARGVGNTTMLLAAARLHPQTQFIVANEGQRQDLNRRLGSPEFRDAGAVAPQRIIPLSHPTMLNPMAPLLIDNYAMLDLLAQTLACMAQMNQDRLELARQLTEANILLGASSGQLAAARARIEALETGIHRCIEQGTMEIIDTAEGNSSHDPA